MILIKIYEDGVHKSTLKTNTKNSDMLEYCLSQYLEDNGWWTDEDEERDT